MSSENGNSQSLKRPHRACLNCRRKKVRCYGEQPACSFCVRLGQECHYSYQAPFSRHKSLSFGGAPTGNVGDQYQTLASRIALIESKLNLTKGGISLAPNQFQSQPADNAITDWTSISHTDPTWLNLEQNEFDFNGQLNPIQSLDDIILPSIDVQWSAIEAYFRYSHNQPYCLFHKVSFYTDFSNGTLPDFLIFAILAVALRFLPTYSPHDVAAAKKYATEAWKSVSAQSFDSDNEPNYRLVQATILLAIFDFTACKHGTAWVKIGLAVSLAQSMQMTEEPPLNLSCAIREEYRRTLWSVYLFDKMASCGRLRPALFLDYSCNLHLPSSEYAWSTLTEEIVPTLQEFKDSQDISIHILDSPARTIVVASVLSQIAMYMFQQSNKAGRILPWDHKSEYSAVSTQLTRLEAMFDTFQPMSSWIDSSFTPSTTEGANTFLFSYIIYQLCYCLINHPFLLHRKVEGSGCRIPPSFLSHAIETCRIHAQELTRTLLHAKTIGIDITPSFFGYCLVVAGTVHAIFQHSPHQSIQFESVQAVESTCGLLGKLAEYWSNSVSMLTGLNQFNSESASYCLLISLSGEVAQLSPSDIGRLDILLDYGAMSSIPNSNGLDI